MNKDIDKIIEQIQKEAKAKTLVGKTKNIAGAFASLSVTAILFTVVIACCYILFNSIVEIFSK